MINRATPGWRPGAWCCHSAGRREAGRLLECANTAFTCTCLRPVWARFKHAFLHCTWNSHLPLPETLTASCNIWLLLYRHWTTSSYVLLSSVSGILKHSTWSIYGLLWELSLNLACPVRLHVYCVFWCYIFAWAHKWYNIHPMSQKTGSLYFCP